MKFNFNSDSLGECLRLVSQVLAGSSSSSNDYVTCTVAQRISGNDFSSTSKVSSAVERARSMFQRSQSTGLYSRLSRRNFEQHRLLPYLVVVEENNKKQF